MNEFYKFKGQFRIESLDKDNNIIDVYEDHNYIMMPARRTISEMFTNTSNAGLKYLVLGTCGLTSNDVPITEENGFNKLRTHLYSEYSNYTNSDSVYLYKHDIIRVNSKYYRYTGNDNTVSLTASNINSLFNEIDKPYTYKLQAKTNVFNGITNIAKNTDNSCVISYTTDTGDNLNNTTVTYTFEIGLTQGNEEDLERQMSVFNEAGMYINNRLFCMKCFPNKVKDNSTRLKIVWKIIF